MSEFDWLEDNYSPSVLRKAEKLLEEESVTPDPEAYRVWWVEGSRPDKKYRVQLVEGPTVICSCPNGQKKGGQPTCYHTAAVALMLKEAEEYDDDDE